MWAVIRRSASIALLLGGCARGGPSDAAEREGPAADGMALLQGEGCLACHALDGTRHVGPPLASLLGSTRPVLSNGEARELVADRAYLARSLRDPNADVVQGYAPGTMPPYELDEEEVSQIAAALEHLSRAPPRSESEGGAVWVLLILSALGFTGFHLLLSSGPIRSRLVSRLGEKGFQGVYSLIALATFVGMIEGWLEAPFVLLWRSPAWAPWIPVVLVPIGAVLFVAGLTTKNPTAAGQASMLEGEPEPYGILRITRHPTNWGFALWAFAHVYPNGDLSSLFLFGSIGSLAVLGMLHIDARRRVAMGNAWSRFVAKTSLLPFAAVLAGHTRLSLREIGAVRITAGIALYVLYLLFHTYIIGVSPYPF